jgi:hypothetical protein
LWPEDLDRLHELWLRLSLRAGCNLHHRDVVGLALRRLERELESERGENAIRDLLGDLQAGEKIRPAEPNEPCLDSAEIPDDWYHKEKTDEKN